MSIGSPAKPAAASPPSAGPGEPLAPPPADPSTPSLVAAAAAPKQVNHRSRKANDPSLKPTEPNEKIKGLQAHFAKMHQRDFSLACISIVWHTIKTTQYTDCVSIKDYGITGCWQTGNTPEVQGIVTHLRQCGIKDELPKID